MRLPAVLLVALAVLGAGCLSEPQASLFGGGAGRPAEGTPIVHTFDGRLTASPAAPVAQDFDVPVADGVRHLVADLSWTTAHAVLDLLLLDPQGSPAATGFAETPTSRALANVEPLAPGLWTVRVASSRALDEAFVANVVVGANGPSPRAVAETYEIEPRLPSPEVARLVQSGGFAEVNVVLESGANFAFDWRATGPVYFNVHYHADGRTERAEEGVASERAGTFTAPRTEVYSLLWRNENPGSVTVDVRVDGVFREHSRTR